jgi:hypothetical protein
MVCPHCRNNFHYGQTHWSVGLGNDKDGGWVLSRAQCPSCNLFIMHLETLDIGGQAPQGQVFAQHQNRIKKSILVRPKSASRAPVPNEVPGDIAQDYNEACLVFSDSPKASAALSRRCLQSLLRAAAGVKPGDLSDEIQQVIDGGKLPAGISDNIDAVRNIGNFAAHPIKSQSTGMVVPVEPHEAEWNLEVLESLFDHYYVQPARARAQREALNKKLQDAKKPPMK